MKSICYRYRHRYVKISKNRFYFRICICLVFISFIPCVIRFCVRVDPDLPYLLPLSVSCVSIAHNVLIRVCMCVFQSTLVCFYTLVSLQQLVTHLSSDTQLDCHWPTNPLSWLPWTTPSIFSPSQWATQSLRLMSTLPRTLPTSSVPQAPHPLRVVAVIRHFKIMYLKISHTGHLGSTPHLIHIIIIEDWNRTSNTVLREEMSFYHVFKWRQRVERAWLSDIIMAVIPDVRLP